MSYGDHRAVVVSSDRLYLRAPPFTNSVVHARRFVMLCAVYSMMANGNPWEELTEAQQKRWKRDTMFLRQKKVVNPDIATIDVPVSLAPAARAAAKSLILHQNH